MKVYIEFVLIDNIVIDFILLYLTFAACKKKHSILRLLLAACFGAAFATVFPFIVLPNVLYFFVKMLCGALILYIAKSYKSLAEFLHCTLIFFLLTFMLGGAILGGFYLFKISTVLDGGFFYVSRFPIGLILLAAFLFLLLIYSLIKKMQRKNTINNFIYKCVLWLGNNKVELNGFLDSGNCLYFENLKPVYICGTSTAAALFKEGLFTNKTRASYLDFQTIGGKSRMMCFEVDKIVIYNGAVVNTLDNIILGVSPYHISGKDDYNLILHPAAFGGVNV